MNTNNEEYKQIENLTNENKKLKQELDFMNQLFKNHGNSMVFHMKKKFKQGKPVWIDTNKITIKQLLELDHDTEIQKLLIERGSVKYSDKY